MNFLVENNVLFGKNDYLFLYQGKQRQFDFLTGVKSPSEESITNFANNIENRLQYCKDRNITYTHIVYPSKPIIKSHELPDGIGRIESLYLKYYKEVIALKNLHDYVHYPIDVLKKEDLFNSVYRKKDTHMTDYGYEAIAKHLSNSLDFKLVKTGLYRTEIMVSDLSAMLGLKSKSEEAVYCNNNFGVLEDNRAFLSGNTGNIVLHYNPMGKGRLLIFGDSFIKDNLKFFFPYFKNILFVRSPFFFKDLVELFSPNYVVTSNAERYLANVEKDGHPHALNPLFLSLIEESYKPSNSFKNMFIGFLSMNFNQAGYLEWEKEIDKKMRWMKMDHLGVLLYNKNINPVNHDLMEFEALNHDPYFLVMPNNNLRYGEMVLRLELESDVDSELEIFYKPLSCERFSEEHKKTFIVNKGYNQFISKFNFNEVSSEFRIDPIKHSGTFTLLKIELFR